MSFEVWNSLPQQDRLKRPALFVEDTFDDKMMGDAWAMIAERLGYEIALRVCMGLGAKISSHRFSNPGQRPWMRFSFWATRQRPQLWCVK